MVTGWRRAFCTSIRKDSEPKFTTETATTHSQYPQTNTNTHTNRSPRFGPKFSFFSSSSSTTGTNSNPSTPRPQAPSPSDDTPSLRCSTTTVKPSHGTTLRLECTATAATTPSKTTKSPRLFLQRSSNPSSPRSPSTFSLLKHSLGLSKVSRCGICVQNVKTGQGTAIFTAECSHSFHFPCIAAHAAKTNNGGALLSCPVCGSHWKEAPLIAVPNHTSRKSPSSDLRLYDDDEPLMSPISGIRFNPIPESDEETETDTDVEFPGFLSDPVTPRAQFMDDILNRKAVEFRLSPEAAVVAVGRSYETYAVLLRLRASPAPPGSRRPSVDLVSVVDVGGQMTATKLQSLKRAMRAVISSLSSNDRLSIVAFSSGSKRLLPLRRMTPSGRRSARRIVDALNIGQGSCTSDALRKAAKVIHDRKERNHFAAIILLDGQEDHHQIRDENNRRFELLSSTRFSHLDIPLHTFRIGEELLEDAFAKSVSGFLSVVVLDLRIQLGLASGSAAAEIAAVYSCTGRPGLLSSGSAKLGDLYTDEEREILIELKVPAAAIGSRHLLSVRSSHKDPSTKQLIYGRDQSIIIPRPHAIRSSDPAIQRLRCLFVMTRAIAESRRLLADRNDLAGAERLLASARAVLCQPSLKLASIDEFRRRVEAELAEVRWRRQTQPEQEKRRNEKGGGSSGGGGCCLVDEKGEPLTPTSAWKAAERLAKVAIMRKSLNRVRDLHGFEDARF